MSNSYSYTSELEHLIIHILIPVYEKYCSENNKDNIYEGFNPELLRQIKRKKVVAALFRPKEKQI